MEHILVVVDMQNDFIDGALGTKEAREIVEAAAEKIREFKGSIYGTLDTHSKDYLSTQEGKNLPVRSEEHTSDSSHWLLSRMPSSA